MISVQDMQISIGARTLISEVNFRVQKGDKIGLVGRNGAGKTTMTKILAGEGQPTDGKVMRSGSFGYLPQDPRAGDPEQLAMTRILNARGLGDIVERLNQASIDRGSYDPKTIKRQCKNKQDFRKMLAVTTSFVPHSHDAQILAIP